MYDENNKTLIIALFPLNSMAKKILELNYKKLFKIIPQILFKKLFSVWIKLELVYDNPTVVWLSFPTFYPSFN